MNKKRKRLSKDERRKQIIKSTADLVALKGFKSVSIMDIARAADINEGLIYRHFSSKEELLNEMLKDFLSKAPKFCDIPETEEEFLQMLSRIEKGFIKLNLEDPNMVKTLLYVALEEQTIPPEYRLDREGTMLYWLSKCIDKGKKEWGFNKDVINEIYISFFIGSMQYYIVTNSVSGIFDLKDYNTNGIFSKMFLKVLKS